MEDIESKKCELCLKIIKNCKHNQKYCFECSVILKRIKAVEAGKERYQREKEWWESLTEEEKAERIKIVSQQLLNQQKEDNE